ncbi:MAG: Hsp70 family protein, partial [Candidatus Zambryskibacteria bacterium]|nr:Hsp70 family protein [Candidatus Zambryskibacteria bacterium]
KDLVDTKNTAEQLVYTAEKSLKDAPTVPEDIKTAVNAKIDALKKEKDGGTLESIKSASESLSTEMQKIGEYMSKNQAASTEGSAEVKPEGEVKDAEVKEEPKEGETPNA